MMNKNLVRHRIHAIVASTVTAASVVTLAAGPAHATSGYDRAALMRDLTAHATSGYDRAALMRDLTAHATSGYDRAALMRD
ncbi:hypothetical protein ACIBG2_10670, partial [Nonomuraea typhae]